MSNEAKFSYSISKKNGYRSSMTGTLRSPEQHGVVTAALAGDLSDDHNILYAAPDLLEALERYVERDQELLAKYPETEPSERFYILISQAREAIKKAKGE